MPFIPPMLPTLVEEPPSGAQWIHEVKYDGFRTQLHVCGSGSQAFTRNGHDWSHLYAHVLRSADQLPRPAVLDGEIMIQDEQGRADFDGLRHAIAYEPSRLVFHAFDLLWIDGHDVRHEPLNNRKARLLELLGANDPERPIQYAAHTDLDGPSFFKAVCQLEVEGIVSKRAHSRYRSGRTRLWLKTKNFTESEFLVVGWEHRTGNPAIAFLAHNDEERLEYAGSAFVTLAAADRDAFWSAMKRLERESAPVDLRLGGVQWVDPELRVRARHLRCPGKLRHATLTSIAA